MSIEEIYNYRRLNATLATSGQPSEAQLFEVAEAGFQVVINLAMTTSDNALDDEASLVKALGLTYIHIPVLWEEPSLADLESFYAVMQAHQEKNVYVHCVANMRVSTFMALYRIQRLGWPVEKAFAEVYAIWQPNPIWQAFIDQVLQT
jgi:uncharacterized protein (TIGR01244 family)